MDQPKLNQLIDKYQKGQLSASEAEELDDWFHSLNLMNADFDKWIAGAGGEDQMAESLFIKFNRRIEKPQRHIGSGRFRWAVAASILFILSAGSVYFLKHRKPQQDVAQYQKQDIAPGGNKAILTLANGKKISLTDAVSGTVAQQANMQINKTSNGQINYIVNKSAASAPAVNGEGAEVVYNTVETPRGGQTSILLSDGTIAYLDAASSIRFPVVFSGKERKVTITGQVYFEVVHDNSKPFRVSVNDLIVEDIGTRFNVNAFSEGNELRTTLLEGKISLNIGRNKTLMKPGQQALIKPRTENVQIIEVDPNDAVAWKNGYFLFDGDNLEGIMRNVSRWYNVDIVFADNETKSQLFSGTVSRFKNVSQVLKKLELTGAVHFKIEGKKIIITK